MPVSPLAHVLFRIRARTFGAFSFAEYNIGTAADEMLLAWPNDITEEENSAGSGWSGAEQGVVSIKNQAGQTPGEMKILIEQAHKRGMTTASSPLKFTTGEYDVELRGRHSHGPGPSLNTSSPWVVEARGSAENAAK